MYITLKGWELLCTSSSDRKYKFLAIYWLPHHSLSEQNKNPLNEGTKTQSLTNYMICLKMLIIHPNFPIFFIM